MTTIAWDGFTLVGDTQCNAIIRRRVNKVFQIKENLFFGGSGLYEDCLLVRTWLMHGGNKPELDDNFSGLIIRDGTAFRIEQKLMESQIQESHHAIGSGSAYAMMAMHLGKTAEEAVVLASVFDSDTNSKIIKYNCITKKKS
jgi:hypothetical protein